MESEDNTGSPDQDEEENNKGKEVMRYVAGRSSFFCLFVMTTVAWSCGVAATSWCSFCKRHVGLVPGANVTEICANFTDTEEQCRSFYESHAVGFWSWQTTVPESNQLVCLSYTQPIPDKGYVTLYRDAYFNTAKFCAVVASIIGLFCFLTLLFGVCCPLDPGRMAGLSCAYFLCTFFQGSTFLIYRSTACQVGFFYPFYSGTLLGGAIESASCSNGRGANLSIAATVFYFVCMCTAPTAQPPEPIGGNPFEEEGQDDDDDDDEERY